MEKGFWDGVVEGEDLWVGAVGREGVVKNGKERCIGFLVV